MLLQVRQVVSLRPRVRVIVQVPQVPPVGFLPTGDSNPQWSILARRDCGSEPILCAEVSSPTAIRSISGAVVPRPHGPSERTGCPGRHPECGVGP